MALTPPVNTGLRITAEEATVLITESRREDPVLIAYGSARLLGPDWALWRVAEMRGLSDLIRRGGGGSIPPPTPANGLG